MDQFYKVLACFVIIPSLSSVSLAQPVAIDERRFVSIGGIEQWITISGHDKSKPVVLFIHGGPGSVLSPFADAIYGEWEKDFILVNWDQRGAGRTFARNAPENTNEEYWMEHPLSLDQMVNDGIELSQYLLKYLGKHKLILMGTSWGSILGTKMALQQPGLFHIYIGHAQFVNLRSNLDASYVMVSALAKSSRDTASTRKLASLGKPPYPDARNLGQLLRIVKQYENARSIAAPAQWFKPGADYDNEKDARARENGDDYSFLYFAGHEKLRIKPMAADIDFREDGLIFQLPVYFIQGEHDILTSSSVNKPWFNKIEAPEKKYFLIPGAAHGFNQAVVDKQYQVLKERFVE